jgi:hypothetical protein
MKTTERKNLGETDFKDIDINFEGTYEFSLDQRPKYLTIHSTTAKIVRSYLLNALPPNKPLALVLYAAKIVLALVIFIIDIKSKILLSVQIRVAILIGFGMLALMAIYLAIIIISHFRLKMRNRFFSKQFTLIGQAPQLLVLGIIIGILALIGKLDPVNGGILYAVIIIILAGAYLISEFTFVFISIIMLFSTFCAFMAHLLQRIICRKCNSCNKKESFVVHTIIFKEEMPSQHCVVCLQNLIVGEAVCKMSCCCDSYYHKNCIVGWWKKSAFCPLCRSPANIL